VQISWWRQCGIDNSEEALRRTHGANQFFNLSEKNMKDRSYKKTGRIVTSPLSREQFFSGRPRNSNLIIRQKAGEIKIEGAKSSLKKRLHVCCLRASSSSISREEGTAFSSSSIKSKPLKNRGVLRNIGMEKVYEKTPRVAMSACP